MMGSTVLRLLRTVVERSGLGLALHRLASHGKVSFVCPICHYRGPFADVSPATGLRKHAKCPKCGALERHRLQYLVVKSLAERYDFSRMSLLHIALEAFFRSRFKS
jgi:hypothetical protein